MMLVTPESFAAAATPLLRLDPPPSESEIADVLERLSVALAVSPETVEETRRLLHSRFAIRMDLGETLISEELHAPWLDLRRASIDPYYWGRYRALLINKGWSPLVVGSLDRATDKLLDLLGDPENSTPWSRRGLVMGEVQSGKTAAYTALISKAADAGYRMVVLLTGTLENVRRQTQERLDEGFIGFDSREFLDDARARHKKHLGVGLLDSRRDGIVFTSHGSDFRKAVASALNIALAAVNEPVLVVTKKNKVVLQRLLTWLSARNADRAGSIDVPMLLIDDEADNASINTRSDPREATAINSAIRDLLRLFRRASYVGFTATPFANIFIDPESTNEMLGDDLFPRDFIHVLHPPTNYLGIGLLFGSRDRSEGGDAPVISESDPVLRAIPDDDTWLPANHKIHDEPGPFPPSLSRALETFLLTTVVRDVRLGKQVSVRDSNPHRTMLVNVSRFTAVQMRVADQLQFELEGMRRAVRLHGALHPRDAARSPAIASLEQCFNSEFAACGVTWQEALRALHESIAPVFVQPVNQQTGSGVIDYSRRDIPKSVRVIAVGGNSLSRGLTLEGLSTSYFTRNARAYDTLLQMGRWFGFRDGYADLCRLWIPEEIGAWYQHVATATSELKSDFLRMERRKATPREFGLRVRSHPGTLLITARNKMASGMDVDVKWEVSLYGRMIESTRLYSDRRRNRENWEHVERFISQLVAAVAAPSLSPHGNALLWADVPAALVAGLLDRFLVHPLNFDFQGEAIAEFLIRKSQEGDPLVSKWRVALPTSGKGEVQPVTMACLPGQQLQPSRRRVAEDKENQSLLVSGKGARVGGRSDLRHAFSVDRYREFNDRAATEEEMRQELDAPLLTVFLLTGTEKVEGQAAQQPYRDGILLPALGMHFPGSKGEDRAQNLIRYRLNRVAQRALIYADLDDTDGPDDADRDD